MKRRRTKTVILRTGDRPRPAPRPASVPVVVELSADGFVQVFGPRHVRVVILNRLDVDDDPAPIRATMASLADAFHLLELPRRHREYYGTNHILATGNVARRTPEGDRRRKENLDFIHDCQQFQDDHVLPKRKKERTR